MVGDEAGGLGLVLNHVDWAIYHVQVVTSLFFNFGIPVRVLLIATDDFAEWAYDA